MDNRLISVLHVLVNNSGATWGESLDKYPDEAWSKLLTLNVQRVFTLTQKLVPMLEKGSKRDGVGRVINVSRIQPVRDDLISDWIHQRCIRSRTRDLRILRVQSRSPPVSQLAYSTDIRLSRHLASQLGPAITVNTLALGPFRSKMMAATLDAFEEQIAGSLPMARIGKGEDVAGACLWLSSKAGEWVTG